LLALVYGLLAIGEVGFTAELFTRIMGYLVISVPLAMLFAYTEKKLEDVEAITTGVASTVIVSVFSALMTGTLDPLALFMTLIGSVVQGFIVGIATYWLTERLG